jgi:uncharacterized protein (TIGR01244 family)
LNTAKAGENRMNYAQLTPTYAVAPQIDPSDADAIRAAGFTDVICNRPDDEVADGHTSSAVEAALTAAGVRFHSNPAVSGAMTEVEVQRQADILSAADGPVLAYCRSGTRSSILWALGTSGMSADDIIASAARAGYDLSPYRAHIGRR